MVKGKRLKNCKLNSNRMKADFEGIDSVPKTLTMKNKKDRIEKRENNIRIPRFKFFKVVKSTGRPKYTRRQKIFDYEVVSDTYIAEPNNMKSKDYFKIEDMIKQVPNISADFNVLYPSLDLQSTNTGNNLFKFGDSRQQFYFTNYPRLDKDNYYTPGNLY